MLDYKLLETLISVVTNSGFERAAINMGLTQSAVSQRIQLLEARLGQPVIIRTPKIEPTEMGRHLLNHIQKVSLLEQDLMFNAPNLNGNKKQFRIALDHDSLITWWPSAISKFIQEKKVSFNLVVGEQKNSLTRMRDGEVVGCICSSPSPLQGARSYPLGVMRYFPMATPSFIENFFPKGMNYQSLKIAPAIIHNNDDTNHKNILEHYNFYESYPKHICTAIDGRVSLIKEGIGYGILPAKLNSSESNFHELSIIKNTFFLEKKIYFHHWRDCGSILNSLIEHLENHFNKSNNRIII